MSTKIRGHAGYTVIDTSTRKPEERAIAEKAPSQATDESRTYSRCQQLTKHSDLAGTAIQHKEREAALANVSIIDKQKVARLRQAIREGKYRIDAERIADKLIAIEQALSKENK